MRSRLLLCSGGTLAFMLFLQSGHAQQPTAQSTAGDWPMYRHDYAGTGYSSLAEIDAKNVSTLKQAWTFSLQASNAPVTVAGAPGRGRGNAPPVPNSEATPIVVGGAMYLPTMDRVVAIDPQTGKEIWQHAVTGGAPSRRGVAYWPGEGATAARIIFTVGRRLIALNAKTGALVTAFGKDGEVEMGEPYNSGRHE